MLKKVKKFGIIILRGYKLEVGMKRKIVKILSIVMMIAVLISICNTSLAVGDYLINTYTGKIDRGGLAAATKLRGILGDILSVVRIVAVGIAIIMLSYLGIQYMSAAPSEKATIKNKLVMLAVGAAVVFGALQIFTFIKNYADAIK